MPSYQPLQQSDHGKQNVFCNFCRHLRLQTASAPARLQPILHHNEGGQCCACVVSDTPCSRRHTPLPLKCGKAAHNATVRVIP